MKLLKFFGPVQMTRGIDDTKDWNHEYHDTPRHFSEHGKKIHMQEEFGHNDRWNMPCPR